MGVIFGVSLEELLLREKRHPAHGGSGIPLLVEFVVNYLRAHGFYSFSFFIFDIAF